MRYVFLRIMFLCFLSVCLSGCGLSDCPIYLGSPASLNRTFEISGTVLYPDNLPIAGVSVTVNSVKGSVVTGSNGSFTINVSAPSGEEVFVNFAKDEYVIPSVSLVLDASGFNVDTPVPISADTVGYLPLALSDIYCITYTMKNVSGVLLQPMGIVFSPDSSRLFVADSTNNRILVIPVEKYRVSGNVELLAGTGVLGLKDGPGNEAEFNHPSSISISADGSELYVADRGSNSIRKIIVGNTPETTTVSTVAGGIGGAWADGDATVAKFWAPYSVVVSSVEPVLYVADTYNNRIRRIVLGDTPETTVISTIAGTGVNTSVDGYGDVATFNNPLGMTIAPDGKTLYVSELSGHRLRRVIPGNSSAETVVSTVAGGNSAGHVDGSGDVAQFRTLYGMCLDSSGKVLFACEYQGTHSSIRRIELGDFPAQTSVSTFSGNDVTGYLDGSGDVAMFRQPEGIAISRDSSVICVADTDDNLLRVLVGHK